MTKYQVIDKNGIFYNEQGGSRTKKFSFNAYITQKDIEAKRVSQGGIELMIKKKRLKLVQEGLKVENKQAIIEGKKG